MKYPNKFSGISTDNAFDPGRRRLLLTMTAAAGAAALGAMSWPGSALAADVQRVRIVIFDNSGQRLDERLLPKVVKSKAQWQQLLAPLAYEVTQEGGTERAFSGHYQIPERNGIYRCICCDTALYDVATMFHSGTGWPSFWQPIADENVRERIDARFGMRRTGIECMRCNAHLGHVFNDGPPPTGLRYCMNSVAMHFAAANDAAPAA